MEDEINLSEYIFIAKKNWWLILLVFLVVLFAGAYYTFSMMPVFEARTLVVVENQDPLSALLGSTAPRIDMNTQTEIIRSYSVMGKLDLDYEINNIRDSNVIEILVRSQSPSYAQEQANMIAERYVNYSTESRRLDAFEVNKYITAQLNSLRAEIEMLSNETDSEQRIAAKEKLYEYLLERREETKIVANENIANIKIIERAQMPTAPVKPNVPVNLAVTFILAVFSGFGLAVFREYVRDTFRRVEDIEELGTILGSIPKSRKIDEAFLEGARKLETNVNFHMKDKRLKSLSVTSVDSKAGKTQIAEQLAKLHEGKVLLVDANLRNHRLSSKLGLSDAKGLTDVILGKAEIEDVIVKKGFDFLPAGTPNESPSELFGSNRMKKLCSSLHYDLVVFDCPTLSSSESYLIGADSDGVLLVVGFDRTRKEKAVEYRKELEKLHINLIGVAVNFR